MWKQQDGHSLLLFIQEWTSKAVGARVSSRHVSARWTNPCELLTWMYLANVLFCGGFLHVWTTKTEGKGKVTTGCGVPQRSQPS